MANSIATVRRQLKAKTADQDTAAARDIVPNKPKLQPLASGSVHGERVSTQVASLKMAVFRNSLQTSPLILLSSPLIEGKGTRRDGLWCRTPPVPAVSKDC